ncbi:MAG: hypothetical protein ACLP5H_15020 [Desulfomonilaceae bacterium]
MPPVYLDGIQLQDECVRIVITAMGTLNETCADCGGSMIEVKSIALHSSQSPTTFLTWCATCGTYSRLIQEFPVEWRRRILAKVGINLRLAS